MGILRDRSEVAKIKRAEKVMTVDELEQFSAAVVEMRGLEERVVELKERIEVLAGNGYVERIQHALDNFCEVPLNRESAVGARKRLDAIDRQLKQQGVMNVAVHEAVEYNLANGLWGVEVFDFRKIQGE